MLKKKNNNGQKFSKVRTVKGRPLEVFDYETELFDVTLKVIHYYEDRNNGRGSYVFATVLPDNTPVATYSNLSAEHAWRMFKDTLSEIVLGHPIMRGKGRHK